MNVLIVGTQIRHTSGGKQTFLLHFLKAFQDHPAIHMAFFPLTPGLQDRESWLRKIFRNFGVIVPFLKVIKPCDIVHFNSTFDNRSILRDCFYGSIALFIFKKRIVFQFHGKRPSTVGIFQNALLKKILYLFFAHVDIFLMLSQPQSNEFQRIFPTLQHLRTVPNFIELNHVVRKEKHQQPVFLFLARLIETKGVKEILYAVRELKVLNMDFSIIFCGDGFLRPWLIESIQAYGLQEYVTYRGPVSGSAKSKILRQADVMLLPTRYPEGFPYTLLEAFQYALPVITSPEGAIPEIIREGVNGFLVDSNDYVALAEKMRFFCENPDQIERMGMKAWQLAKEEYSLEKMVQIFSDVYSWIIRK